MKVKSSVADKIQKLALWRIPVHQKPMTLSAFMVCATLGWVHPQVFQAKVEEDCTVCASVPSNENEQTYY